MRILLVNAKPSLIEALKSQPGVDPVGLWPRKHDFPHLLDATNAKALYYSGGKKLSPAAAWQMRKAIRNLRPDVIHAFYGRALAHVALATTGMHGRPRIVSFRGITPPLAPLNAGDWITYRHPNVDAHACESNAVRESMILSGVPAERCWTTYNSMYFQPLRRPGREGLAQFGIPANAFVVGTMAAMRPVKRIDLLLQAATQLADLGDLYWVLFGQVLDPAIKRLAADPRIRDRVRLVGFRTDASELISGANLFVMPSRAEALCQALLEAMHQGVCPVVSDAGGMKEVVRHGRDGLVVPAESASALAAAIRSLHADRPQSLRFAVSAAQRIADDFTPARMAERTLAIYSNLLNSEPSHCAA